MQTEKKYSKKQREFIELYMSQNLIRLSSEARELENKFEAAISEAYEHGKSESGNVLPSKEETYREYDLPGSGYFVHLLNQPLIDYNILDAIVMGIVMGAAGFIIFVLLKL